jgi:hypothetical protein
MQAIEFEANLRNGSVQLPLAYQDWYNQTVKVILLKNDVPKTPLKNAWEEVDVLRQQLKNKSYTFSDSADLIREMRDQ